MVFGKALSKVPVKGTSIVRPKGTPSSSDVKKFAFKTSKKR
jgi:hypothetical protein